MIQVFWAELVRVTNDKGPYKLATVRSHDHEFEVKIFEPYGVQGSPINKGQALVTMLDNDLGKAVAQIMPPPADRVDGLSEGEVQFINHKTGSFVKIDKDGNVVISATTLKIEANIEIEGDITQTGDFNQTGIHTDSNGPHTV